MRNPEIPCCISGYKSFQLETNLIFAAQINHFTLIGTRGERDLAVELYGVTDSCMTMNA